MAFGSTFQDAARGGSRVRSMNRDPYRPSTRSRDDLLGWVVHRTDQHVMSPGVPDEPGAGVEEVGSGTRKLASAGGQFLQSESVSHRRGRARPGLGQAS
jgi:hypothetical protein